jgi:hypothetical protein
MQTKSLQFLIVLTFVFSGSVFGQETKKSHALKNISPENTNKKVSQIYNPSVKNLENLDENFRKKTQGDWSIMLGGLTFVRPKYMGSDQYKVNGFL